VNRGRAARPPGAGVLFAALGLIALGACVKNTVPGNLTAAPGTPVDSVTVALWRLDETGGVRAADSGPARLNATAGPDTRTIYGRFRNARLFTASANSFLYVPYSPVLDLSDSLTIEAWVAPNAYPLYEDAPIAARWSPVTDDRSWIFALVGNSATQLNPSPGWHMEYVRSAPPGRLLFVYQPEDAGVARWFLSLTSVELQRWSHVAVSFDGQVVRFWIDGQPQGTFATAGRIRSSRAPLISGNFFDTRFLTDFGGDLRQGPTADTSPWYALDGGIDELRISRAPRTEFPLHGGK
jgi:hypothetical protein